MSEHDKTNPPQAAISRKQMARSLFQNGELKQAESLYEELCRENNMDAESYYMLGSINGQLGKYHDSARYFRLSIDLQPNAVVTHRGLGSALKELGQFSEAEACFRQAIRLDPDSPETLLALANTLLNQDKLQDAQEQLQTVLKLQPDSPEALRGMGELCQARKRFTESISYYRKSLELAPDSAITHQKLGFVMLSNGEITEAIRHYQHALELDPGMLDALTNIGYAQLLSGQPEPARSAFKTALEINRDNIDAIVGMAAVDERTSNFQAAYDRVLPLIKDGIQHVALAITYGRLCRHFGCCQEAIDYLEKMLEFNAHKISAREQMHFSLGKLYDLHGMYDEAFDHFRQGNESQPDTYNPVEHAFVTDKLIDTFNWRFNSIAPRATYRSERPIFIVGMQRSGTTLVEQILSSHPLVFGAGELPDISEQVINIPSLAGSATGFPRNIRELTPDNMNTIAKAYLDHLQELAPQASRVTDKMPQNYQHLGIISLAFPDARVIHCVRDPRDTCLSIYFQNFLTRHVFAANLKGLGLYYRQYLKLMTHWKSLLDIPIMEVKYERLVNNQEELSREILEFAGLEWNDKVLDFHEHERVVLTASYDQVRQPVYTSSIGRWKNYEKHLAPLLDALGDVPLV